MRRLLLALLLLALCLCAASQTLAADLPALSLVAGLDDSTTFGAALSWHATDVADLEAWLDVGCKRDDGSTEWFVGASTPAVPLLARLPLLRLLAPALDRTFSDRARVGAGVLTSGEPLVYLAYSTDL